MNSKERVLIALDHKEPDKVPLDSWIAREVNEVLAKLLSVDSSKDEFALAKALGNDVLYSTMGISDGFNSIYRPERKIGDNLYQDHWGIRWMKKSHQYGSYCEFAEHPLADAKNYGRYQWHNPLICEQEGIELYRRLLEREGKTHAIAGFVPCTMLEASWYLRGLENFFMDLILDRDFANELLEKTMAYHLTLSKKLVEMGVDIIFWGDDIGMETGPFIEPALYRELIKPKYAYMVQEVKRINRDVKVAFHTDGNIEWALDDIVDVGIDILNPLQPDVNDCTSIKKRYGKRLTVWGNVDTRRVLSLGTCGEVVEEVRKVIRTLAPGGGHILCSNHKIQATSRAVENTIAYYWAAGQLRSYPIRF
jgi:uroporphyrinogen decarboxylase